jgi:hypothetical protein
MTHSGYIIQAERILIIGIFLLLTLTCNFPTHDQNQLHIESTDTIAAYCDDSHKDSFAVIHQIAILPVYSPEQKYLAVIDAIENFTCHLPPLPETRGPPA